VQSRGSLRECNVLLSLSLSQFRCCLTKLSLLLLFSLSNTLFLFLSLTRSGCVREVLSRPSSPLFLSFPERKRRERERERERGGRKKEKSEERSNLVLYFFEKSIHSLSFPCRFPPLSPCLTVSLLSREKASEGPRELSFLSIESSLAAAASLALFRRRRCFLAIGFCFFHSGLFSRSGPKGSPSPLPRR
jgi:hypothetical protein